MKHGRARRSVHLCDYARPGRLSPGGQRCALEPPDFSDRGKLFYSGLRPAEAGPLYRRALAIDEKSFGPDHSNVARGLNNLAGLLRDTNRLAEAEPLYRRALRIFVEFGYRTGHEHPHFRTAIDNYAGLISAMGLSQDAIAVRVRSAIEGETEESA
jgi:tetratricopeptide (TPR) repeat protein